MARNDYAVKVTTKAVCQPIKLEEAKKQLELIGVSHHDRMLEMLIAAAEQKFRSETSLQFGEQDETLYLKCFPPSCYPILLPVRPVQSVASIEYDDADGNPQTLTSTGYDTLLNMDPARIEPTAAWPATKTTGEAVRVNIKTGFASTDEYPEVAKQAVLILVAIMFAERAGTPPNKNNYRIGDDSALYASLRDQVKAGDDFLAYAYDSHGYYGGYAWH